MGSLVRLAGASALAVVACACAFAPGGRSWSGASLVGQSAVGAEYADFLSARYAGLTNDPASAARYSRRAAERAPEDVSLLERAAFATLIDGDVPAASQIAAAANAKTLAGAPFAQLTLIVDDVAAGRNARALKRLDGASLGALNDDVARGLSAWLLAKGNTDKGVERANVPEGRRRLAGEFDDIQGLILSSANRDAEALAKFEDGWKLRARMPYLAAAHARLAAATGDAAQAKEILDLVAATEGATPETDAARAMLDGREPAKPLRLSTKQGAAAAIYVVASGPVTRANPDLSVVYLSLALHIDPDLQPARLQLADALRAGDRPRDALAQLRLIKAGSPYAPEALIDEANLLKSLGETGAALDAARSAVAATRARDVVLQAADVFRGAEKYSEAEGLYNDVIRDDAAAGRKDWRPLFARATVRDKLGRWAEAEPDLKLALQYEPNRPEVLNFLGYGWVDRGENVEEGFRLIKQAIQARPDQGYIIDSLGWAHYRRGDYEEAVAALEKAAELEPADAVITDHLGDAYWRAGRRTEAGFEWRRALQLKPETTQATGLKQKLADGLPALVSRTSDAGRIGQGQAQQ
ncbi:MAG: tetratricopeptide repeat protein [Alphaproteobacteria bacterium]